jgi:hypothetical protein
MFTAEQLFLIVLYGIFFVAIFSAVVIGIRKEYRKLKKDLAASTELVNEPPHNDSSERVSP